jgi:hypothetical protein
MVGMPRNGGIVRFDYLPCAGITLIRFYGYFSAVPPVGEQHPEESVKHPAENMTGQNLR